MENAPSIKKQALRDQSLLAIGEESLSGFLCPKGVDRGLALVVPADDALLAESHQQTRGTVEGDADSVRHFSAGGFRIVPEELNDLLTLGVLLQLRLRGLRAAVGIALLKRSLQCGELVDDLIGDLATIDDGVQGFGVGDVLHSDSSFLALVATLNFCIYYNRFFSVCQEGFSNFFEKFFGYVERLHVN